MAERLVTVTLSPTERNTLDAAHAALEATRELVTLETARLDAELQALAKRRAALSARVEAARAGFLARLGEVCAAHGVAPVPERWTADLRDMHGVPLGRATLTLHAPEPAEAPASPPPPRSPRPPDPVARAETHPRPAARRRRRGR